MGLTSFAELITKLKEKKSPKRVAVVAADDKHTLEALIMAQKDGVVAPILIGDAAMITSYLTELDFPIQDAIIVDAASHDEAAHRAVEMIHAGEADFIMKGRLETAALMKIIVNKDSNLRTGRIMSHIAFLEIPTYHKLLAVTDIALNPIPNLAQKRQIIDNAIIALEKMGITDPKVAVMAAAEEVNLKLSDSVEASELKQMNLSGELKGCIVEGPISYDLAMDKEAADIKRYNSPVAGDTDLMVVPNITAGNLMLKALVFSGGAKSAGFIVGAKVPVVLTSRSSSTEDKYMSVVLAASAC